MQEKYITEILKLSNKAKKNKCVPVGAIVVENGKIIAKGYNKKEKTNNPLDHAEIIAIKNAAKRNKNWRLAKCDLYVTMSPCEMCKCVIAESRIKNIYYLIDNEKHKIKTNIELNKINFIKINEHPYEKKYTLELKEFFQEKRKKNIQ